MVLMVVFVVLTDIWFSSPGKQAERNAGLYRLPCLILSVVCLILLILVCILGVKREYTTPCIYNKRASESFSSRFKADNLSFTDSQNLAGFVKQHFIPLIQLLVIIINPPCRMLQAAEMQLEGIILALTSLPTVLCFVVQNTTPVCPGNDRSEDQQCPDPACSIEECQDRYQNIPFKRKEEYFLHCLQLFWRTFFMFQDNLFN